EAISAEPVLIGRVVAHDLLEQQVCGRGETHRGTGVTVAHLLNGVCCENPRRVDCLVVDGLPLECCHWILNPSLRRRSGSILACSNPPEARGWFQYGYRSARRWCRRGR